jgi:hypothetical protein
MCHRRADFRSATFIEQQSVFEGCLKLMGSKRIDGSKRLAAEAGNESQTISTLTLSIQQYRKASARKSELRSPR